MRKRDPVILSALAQIQTARQIAADAALAEARAAEVGAAKADHAARTELNAAEGMWRDLLARPSFAPELSRCVAHVLISREADAAAAAAALQLASDEYLDRHHEWRVAEAQKRTATRVLRDASRTAARRREDKRSDALADRVTQEWSRT